MIKDTDSKNQKTQKRAPGRASGYMLFFKLKDNLIKTLMFTTRFAEIKQEG
jgi:hypothetical protein